MTSINFSVVIPAYNVEECIGRALESVLSQTYKPNEIIVVDDGSTDSTKEILEKYSSSGIKVIFQENMGVSAARNAGVLSAGSEWIAFLDSDDEWIDNYLAGQKEIIELNPDIKWLMSNFFVSDLLGNKKEKVNSAKAIRLLKDKKYCDKYFKLYADKIFGHTSSTIVNREALDNVGLFENGVSFLEDMDLWWRLAFAHPKVGYNPHPSVIRYLSYKDIGLTYKIKRVDEYVNPVLKNLGRAHENGMSKEFVEAIRPLSRIWVRSMLFENRPEDIRLLLRQLKSVLGNYFVIFAKVLTYCPLVTARILRFISFLLRLFNIRRSIHPKPRPLKK